MPHRSGVIISQLMPILGSPGERYLREERGIDVSAIEDILDSTYAVGWHPAAFFKEEGHALNGQRLGCIVGVMTDPATGRPTGAISRTYLANPGKVCKAKSWGTPLGIVRLSRDEDVHEGLFLAEGLETALTAAALGLRPVWSTGSHTTLAKFPVLAGIEALTLIADNDANGAGEKAARETEARWLQAGPRSTDPDAGQGW
jgi:hypothetical protein